MQQVKAGKKQTSSGAGSTSGNGRFYKIGEVCAMTDTQPYVLRFWESEFPQLAPRKSRSGQRLYEKKDVELVVQIKQLLYDEEYTIAGARKKLEDLGYEEPFGSSTATPASAAQKTRTRSGPASRPGLVKLRKELMELKKILES